MFELIVLNVAVANVCYARNVCETLEPEVIEAVQTYYKEEIGIELNFVEAEPIQSELKFVLPIDNKVIKNINKNYNVEEIDLTLIHGTLGGNHVGFLSSGGMAWPNRKVAAVYPLIEEDPTDYQVNAKAIVIAHELGHLLGLDHEDEDAEENLMHPAGGDFSGHLSENQVNRMRNKAEGL